MPGEGSDPHRPDQAEVRRVSGCDAGRIERDLADWTCVWRDVISRLARTRAEDGARKRSLRPTFNDFPRRTPSLSPTAEFLANSIVCATRSRRVPRDRGVRAPCRPAAD